MGNHLSNHQQSKPPTGRNWSQGKPKGPRQAFRPRQALAARTAPPPASLWWRPTGTPSSAPQLRPKADGPDLTARCFFSWGGVAPLAVFFFHTPPPAYPPPYPPPPNKNRQKHGISRSNLLSSLVPAGPTSFPEPRPAVPAHGHGEMAFRGAVARGGAQVRAAGAAGRRRRRRFFGGRPFWGWLKPTEQITQV